MSEEKKEKVKLVFIGVRFCSKSKLHDVYLEITDEEIKGRTLPNDGEERWYKASRTKMPGVIYEFDQEVGTTSIYMASAVYFGSYGDLERVARWATIHQSVKDRYNLIRMRKKAEQWNAALYLMGPIKREYQRAVGSQKSLIVSRVVTWLTDGKPVLQELSDD